MTAATDGTLDWNEVAHRPECIEASRLGWAPGVWPATFVHVGRLYRRGAACRNREGDLLAFRYRSTAGLVVEVLNG